MVSEMTNTMAEDRGSRAQERPAKRDRLIDAASQLFYEQGVERTTIADIAAAADVPAGNVYYYFKTKDDIVDAVVSMRIGEIEATVCGPSEAVRHSGRSTQGTVQIAFGASRNNCAARLSHRFSLYRAFQTRDGPRAEVSQVDASPDRRGRTAVPGNGAK